MTLKESKQLQKMVEVVQEKHDLYDRDIESLREDIEKHRIKHIDEVIQRLHELRPHREAILVEVDKVLAKVPDVLKSEWRMLRENIADVSGFIDTMLDLKIEWKKKNSKSTKKGAKKKNEKKSV